MHRFKIEPLDWREIGRLDAFFAELGRPAATMDFEALDGLFHALVIGPEIVPATEYLREVWGDADVFADRAEAEQVIGLLKRQWNTIAGCRMTQMQFSPHLRRRPGVQQGAIWAGGFVKGGKLRAAVWKKLKADQDAADLLDEISSLTQPGLDGADRRTFLLQLPEALRDIADFWLDQTNRPKRMLRALRDGGTGGLIARRKRA